MRLLLWTVWTAIVWLALCLLTGAGLVYGLEGLAEIGLALPLPAAFEEEGSPWFWLTWLVVTLALASWLTVVLIRAQRRGQFWAGAVSAAVVGGVLGGIAVFHD